RVLCRRHASVSRDGRAWADRSDADPDRRLGPGARGPPHGATRGGRSAAPGPAAHGDSDPLGFAGPVRAASTRVVVPYATARRVCCARAARGAGGAGTRPPAWGVVAGTAMTGTEAISNGVPAFKPPGP